MIRYLLILFLLAGSAQSYTGRPWTADSVGQAAATNDSIYWTDVADTIWCGEGASSLTLRTAMTFDYGIVGIGPYTNNVFIDLSGKVFMIDTLSVSTSSNKQAGIMIAGGGGGAEAYSIRIANGTITASTGNTGTDRLGVGWAWVYDVRMDSVHIKIDGHEALGLFGHRQIRDSYVKKCEFWMNGTSYNDRQYFDGGVAMIFWNDNIVDTMGTYTHVTIDSCIVHTAPHCALNITGDNRTISMITKVFGCSLVVDAQNELYDTLACFATGTCGVGNSSANSYIFRGAWLYGGSDIHDNVMVSGSAAQGSGGAFLEHILAEDTSHVQFRDNIIKAHRGPDGENIDGVCRVMRVRTDYYHWDYVDILGNHFEGTGDSAFATAYVGKRVVVLEPSFWDEDINYGHLLCTGNVAIMRALDVGIQLDSSAAAEYQTEENWPDTNRYKAQIRNNKYISSGNIVSFSHNSYSGVSARYITLTGDTLAHLDTTSDSGVLIPGRVSWHVGGSIYHNSYELYALDCQFDSGAYDTSIEFAAVNAHELALYRTLTVTVESAAKAPIVGCTVMVWNAYAADTTARAGTVSMGTTDITGVYSDTVTYWYESNLWSDSTAFSGFRVKAVNNTKTDSASVLYTVSDTTAAPTVTLGDEPAAETYSPYLKAGAVGVTIQ